MAGSRTFCLPHFVSYAASFGTTSPNGTDHFPVVPAHVPELDRFWVVLELIEHVRHVIPIALKPYQLTLFTFLRELEGNRKLKQDHE